jgi:SAM-dependent methyltransferase
MTAPMAVYGAALRRAASGRPAQLGLMGADGAQLGWVDPSLWSGGLRPGDRALLDRCCGTTLDVGCGPGRLAAALTQAGQVTLGVDVSAEAIRQARRRGVEAVRASVFEPLPREGAWCTILLADGNIGIGGDPRKLLSRCASLLHSRGIVVAEVQPPGVESWCTDVVLCDEDRASVAFPWAAIAAHDVGELARDSAFQLLNLWTEAGRWFARLTVD